MSIQAARTLNTEAATLRKRTERSRFPHVLSDKMCDEGSLPLARPAPFSFQCVLAVLSQPQMRNLRPFCRDQRNDALLHYVAPATSRPCHGCTVIVSSPDSLRRMYRSSVYDSYAS